MSANITSQRGLSLIGLIFFGIIVVVIVVFAMRVVPDVVEYTKIVADIKAVANDPALKQASIAEVRQAFDRRANIDQIESLKPLDLDVVRNGSNWALSFSYRKEFKLVGPVSLVIDFKGSSDQ